MYTEHSYLTEEELVRRVENLATSTSMEVELASRLSSALDYIEVLEDLLEQNGIELEFVETPLQ